MSPIVRTSRSNLRDLTAARVSLPVAGNSVATEEVLSFQLAHAKARDAVHARLHLPSFARRITSELPVLADAAIPLLLLWSNAADRAAYLRQPNLGRTLHPDSVALLHPAARDLAIIVADGLSALAIERHAIPLLAHLLPQLLRGGWSLGPVTLVEQARVAIGDAIGFHLGARCSLILIGERPGLSSPDSMGAYVTWAPHPERTDAERNCLSNIRGGGLLPVPAADRLFRYLEVARAAQRTGIALKEGTLELDSAPLPSHD